MISSLESNNRLRRNKESYSRFSKKTHFADSNLHPLSQEENLIIIKERKRSLKKKERNKYLFALFMLTFYGTIIVYVLRMFLY